MKNCHAQFNTKKYKSIVNEEIVSEDPVFNYEKQNIYKFSTRSFVPLDRSAQSYYSFIKNTTSQKPNLYLKRSSAYDLKKSIYPQSFSNEGSIDNKSFQQNSFLKNLSTPLFNQRLNNSGKNEQKKHRYSQNINSLGSSFSKPMLAASYKNQKLQQSTKKCFSSNFSNKNLPKKQLTQLKYQKQNMSPELKEVKGDVESKKSQIEIYKSLQKNTHFAHLRYPSSYNHLHLNQRATKQVSTFEQKSNKLSPLACDIKFNKKRASQQLGLKCAQITSQKTNQKLNSLQKLQFSQSQVSINVSSSSSSIQQDQMTARFNCHQDSIRQSCLPRTDKLQSSATSLGKHVKIPPSRRITLQQFQIGPCKGKGRFGKVYMVIDKLTGAIFALKQISITSIKSMQNQFISEIKLQSFLDHAYVTKIYGYFVEKENFYIIMEYMNQGNLYQLIKKQGCLTEIQSATKLFQVSQALNHMHKNDIIHRDIKPQNVVLNFDICKICDFSWATRSNQRRQTNCGTLDYLCPQIIEGSSYDKSIDLWSVGVLLYEMLVGKAPFYNISVKQTAQKIKQCSFKLPYHLSSNSRTIIQCFLKKDPSQRKQLDQILSHDFFKQVQQ